MKGGTSVEAFPVVRKRHDQGGTRHPSLSCNTSTFLQLDFVNFCDATGGTAYVTTAHHLPLRSLRLSEYGIVPQQKVRWDGKKNSQPRDTQRTASFSITSLCIDSCIVNIRFIRCLKLLTPHDDAFQALRIRLRPLCCFSSAVLLCSSCDGFRFIFGCTILPLQSTSRAHNYKPSASCRCCNSPKME